MLRLASSLELEINGSQIEKSRGAEVELETRD